MRILLLLLLLFPASLMAQGDHAQQCDSVANVPLPQEAEVPKPGVFPACEAYKSYAGIGRAVDYTAARSCAWKERAAQQINLSQNQKAPTAWAIGGDLILVDLYANGLGVPRNLPLALHLACEDGTGIAADAITDLDKFAKTAPPSPKRFEVCDFANSTFSMNFCGDYQSEITEERRNRAFRRILAQWTPEQKTAFAKLKAAEEKYVETHTSELDQGGTIHTIRDLGSMEIMHNNFLLDLRQFEKGNLPKDTNAPAAESRMTKQYQTNLAAARLPLPKLGANTAVTQDDVIEVQATWEHYRDAWLAFTSIRYPSVPAMAFRAYFADERYRLLSAMRSQIYRD